MGSSCNSCRMNTQISMDNETMKTSDHQQKSEVLERNKSSERHMSIASSRYQLMPSKQQTLTPLNLDIEGEMDELDQRLFENQFQSFQKTATFISNPTKHQRIEQTNKSLHDQQDNQPFKQVAFPVNDQHKIIEKNTRDATDSISPQTVTIQLAKQQIQNTNQIKQQITEKKKLERKSSNLTQKANQNKADRSDIKSVNADLSGQVTPRTKGILKNKDKSFNRAKSLYSNNKDDTSQKTQNSKKVKFDPKACREKGKNNHFNFS